MNELFEILPFHRQAYRQGEEGREWENERWRMGGGRYGSGGARVRPPLRGPRRPAPLRYQPRRAPRPLPQPDPFPYPAPPYAGWPATGYDLYPVPEPVFSGQDDGQADGAGDGRDLDLTTDGEGILHQAECTCASCRQRASVQFEVLEFAQSRPGRPGASVFSEAGQLQPVLELLEVASEAGLEPCLGYGISHCRSGSLPMDQESGRWRRRGNRIVVTGDWS